VIAKIAHRINGAVLIGLALLSLAAYHPPVGKGDSLLSLKGSDFLADVVWDGCKAQAVKKLAILSRGISR
jgi:hypothetical protein